MPLILFVPPTLRLLAILLAVLGMLVAGPARADAPAAAVTSAAPADDTLSLHNRRIVTFRAARSGVGPAERVEAARSALEAVLSGRGPGVVTRAEEGGAILFQVDGSPMFFLDPDDVAGPRSSAGLEVYARQVEHRLALAVTEAREMTDPRSLAIGAGFSVAATVILLLLLRAAFALRRRGLAALEARLHRLREEGASRVLLATYVDHVRTGARLVAGLLTWGFVLLVLDLWVTFVLRQFAYTRPWGEGATRWVAGQARDFALGIAGAVPGLLTAALVFLLARLGTRALGLFLQRVETGEVASGWLDRDTAGPTRRLGAVVIWLFAIAMAYPYLPGANSEAFKGVTVLAGLMLSLGASGVVGQAMAGFSLMYSRCLRVGEYVKIGDTEGTVTALGMFATKVHTGLGEEVSLPNAVVFSQPVRNFSRLVRDGQFVLHTAVTIGYSTPWRQVHAMLLEAARRTPGVADDPAPYVVQTALSDFYVEYRLCAHGNKSAPRRRAEAVSALHANVQDVFNENGVQIMSPHYRSDPPQAQVIPPEGWNPALAPRAEAPGAPGKG